MRNRCTLAGTLTVALAAACSGGGGGGGPSGLFLDNAVSGLDYSSGTILGTTTAEGRFAYGSGQTVLFSIGDVILGVATGAAVVTPVDLVPGAVDEQDEAVINLARFLQTIDLDQDPANGIVVDALVRQAAVGVTPPDFTQSVAAFEASAQGTVNTLTAGLPGGPRALIPAQDAQDHLGNTLRTIVAGRYDGTFAGDDSGPFHVYVDREGVLFGWAVSASDGPLALTGGADTDGGFVAGDASSGATFSGTIEPDGTLSGNWQLPPESGTFQGTRTVALDTDMDEDLIDALAGTYDGTFTSNFGSEPFTLLLDAGGNFALPPPDDQIAATIVSTSGTRATFNGLTDEGEELSGTVDAAGALGGSFENDLTGERGTFTATRQ